MNKYLMTKREQRAWLIAIWTVFCLVVVVFPSCNSEQVTQPNNNTSSVTPGLLEYQEKTHELYKLVTALQGDVAALQKDVEVLQDRIPPPPVEEDDGMHSVVVIPSQLQKQIEARFKSLERDVEYFMNRVNRSEDNIKSQDARLLIAETSLAIVQERVGKLNEWARQLITWLNKKPTKPACPNGKCPLK